MANPTLPEILRKIADEIEQSGTDSSPPCFALMYVHADEYIMIGVPSALAELHAAISMLGIDENHTKH